MIIPPGPGVLCAYGDATTRLRNEASRTPGASGSTTLSDAADRRACSPELEAEAAQGAGHGRRRRAATRKRFYQIDMRYAGQGMKLTVDVDAGRFSRARAWPASPSASTRCTSNSSPSRSTPATNSSACARCVQGAEKTVRQRLQRRRGGERCLGGAPADAPASTSATAGAKATIYDRCEAERRQSIAGPGHRASRWTPPR